MGYQLLRADARRIPLPDRSVHCVVTSPPYYGLRDYGTAGQIGQEKTPDEYVAALVAVFREVRRILRDDGTAWLNLGDSYVSSPPGNTTLGVSAKSTLNGANGVSGTYRARLAAGHATKRDTSKIPGLKSKDLIGVPWRVARALQEDGWYWRQTVIWWKSNPMPESCTDRPTSAFEPVFLLAKRPRYAFDWYACAKPSKTGGGAPLPDGWRLLSRVRNVWKIPTRPFKGDHFATMPPALAERCVKLGTPEAGCCAACGAPRARVVGRRFPTRPGDGSKVHGANSREARSRDPAHRHEWDGKVVGNRDPLRHVTAAFRHEGWAATCRCGTESNAPCVVFDPFNVAGTTGLVAAQLGRLYFGTDLNQGYLGMSDRRIGDGLRTESRIATVKALAPLPGQLSLFGDQPAEV